MPPVTATTTSNIPSSFGSSGFGSSGFGLSSVGSSSSPSSSGGSPNGTGNGGGRDPSGYVTNPPSVVVKVVNTGRDDINGLMGIVVSYNLERQRYLVHMTLTQSTMALQPKNLQRASMVESYRAQWQQLQNDPRVKDKMTQYLALCQQQVSKFGFDLGSVVFSVVFVWIVLIYLVGLIKTLMVTSLIVLLTVIAGPDLVARRPPHVVLRNFPERTKEVIEKQMPVLKGKLTNKMSSAILMFLLAFCIQSLFVVNSNNNKKMVNVPSSTVTTAPPPQQVQIVDGSDGSYAGPTMIVDIRTIQKYYDLGYKDSSNNKEHGTSIQDILESLQKSTTWAGEEGLEGGNTIVKDNTMESDDLNVKNLDATANPPIQIATIPPQPVEDPNQQTLFSKITNLTNVASIFYLYRTILDLGTCNATQLFSIGQLAANMQHSTEWWRKVLLVLSLYNVIRIFI